MRGSLRFYSFSKNSQAEHEIKIPPPTFRSRSFTRFTMRVGLPHLGQSVLLVVSMIFLRSAVLAILAMCLLLSCLMVSRVGSLPGNAAGIMGQRKLQSFVPDRRFYFTLPRALGHRRIARDSLYYARCGQPSTAEAADPKTRWTPAYKVRYESILSKFILQGESMRRFVLILFAVMAISAFAADTTVKGYLVDLACAAEDGQKAAPQRNRPTERHVHIVTHLARDESEALLVPGRVAPTATDLAEPRGQPWAPCRMAAELLRRADYFAARRWECC